MVDVIVPASVDKYRAQSAYNLGIQVLDLSDRLEQFIDAHQGESIDTLCRALHGDRNANKEITAWTLSLMVADFRIEARRPCGAGHVTRYYPVKKAGGQ